METSGLTYKFEKEDEAIAFVSFLCDCNIKATRKGKSVKAQGVPDLLNYLFDKFIQLVLI